jgi:dTDP-4-dehydrorhamnose 3,5-epimerase
MSSLTVTDLRLPGLRRVQRKLLADERGLFARLFCAEELATAGWRAAVAQVNHSVTRQRGTVRGMHYQRSPHTEMKLVSCVRGEVWDVVVDLRVDSPTYLQWHAESLRAADGGALLIPAGFAHGFQALSHDAELVYCHSAPYVPAAEAGLHVRDARLAIPWPLPVQGLSARDAAFAWLTPGFEGVKL